MTYHPHGKHLIAGAWVASDEKFKSEPVDNAVFEFSVGGAEDVAAACTAAAEAFKTYGNLPDTKRGEFLNSIADEINARGEDITRIGSSETGLPSARLEGERGRTVTQLRLFADHILKGGYLDRRHDKALPSRVPLPRPDLKMIQRPIGPVGVFGASNFPLAFSTAGGDTAAALAAGCPVVVKGHSAHPGTGEIIAAAIDAAVKRCGLHAGVFSMIQGGNRDVGQALVLNENIQAIGFTGSKRGGRALFDLACARPKPIPFFGELGSVNPMFILPHALQSRGEAIAVGWAASMTMGAGQFCTNPGIVILQAGPGAEQFLNNAAGALESAVEQKMLTQGISEAYLEGRQRVATTVGVRQLVSNACAPRASVADLFTVSGSDWLSNPLLVEEVFGPLGIIVTANDRAQMIRIAEEIEGQLTCTLHLDDDDHAEASRLMAILEHKAGRILANSFPTGVEVCDSMVHGGPYPASTNFGATSVGTLAIRRFLRPVCYQNIPDALLPSNWAV